MKRLLLIIACVLVQLTAPAQKISKVDFDGIKKALEGSPWLYKSLQERFEQADTTLSSVEYQTLYYGQCFQENYNPYDNGGENFELFRKYYDKEDFANALPVAMKMIKENPMDIRMTFKALICNHYLKDEDSKKKMTFRYENLLFTIFESGDGKTPENAFVVMKVSDEYELMANMQVQHSSQSLHHGASGPCDMMTLKPNDLGIERLYFNVSKLFEYMQKALKGK